MAADSDTKTLDQLRDEIDAIDDSIHDLIMRRTAVVEGVSRLKQGQAVKIRPSREASILYRLVERHRGPFPKRELVRIWRELITATLSFEGPFSMAVYVSEDEPGYHDLARDQYGSYTSLTEHRSAQRVIESVRNQEATVGILPVPVHTDPNPWWRHLVSTSADAPRIIARLPFAMSSNNRHAGLEALVICPAPQEKTGRDVSFLVVDATAGTGPATLERMVSEAGLSVRFSATWHEDEKPEVWLHLVELYGFLPAGDARLNALKEAMGPEVTRVVSLGGYAVPFSEEELKP